jgi:hypothetical protein
VIDMSIPSIKIFNAKDATIAGSLTQGEKGDVLHVRNSNISHFMISNANIAQMRIRKPLEGDVLVNNHD